MKKWFLGWILFFISTLAYATENYSIILLAEDNGTSLHIFKEEAGAASLPLVREIFTEKTTATLALFADNPESLPLALKKLFDHSATEIQHLKISQPLDIHVLSQGEIQLLKKEKREVIYSELQKFILNHYKNFFNVKDFAMVSGKMKALFGWITVNYLGNHLQNGTPTFGSIFVSNQSLDIAYAVPHSEKPLDETVLLIHGKKYLVFAKSFLELGLQNIHEHLDADEFAKFCYPKEFPVNKHEEGEFNLLNCSEIFRGALKNANLSKRISPTYRVPQFIAAGDFNSTYRFFGIDHDFDQESFEQDILEPQCHNVWDTLKNAYPAEPAEALMHYCSDGIYFSNLFFETLDLRAGQVKVVNTMNDHHLQWVLGAVIYPHIRS
ncbi:MAG TPA: hypothetical protein VHM20_06290 [Gammaproteobacteria bacterium]|jgi:hypothetical protein|nr:hypothetical protein [Gammaproteobacteria bacterium]